MSSKRMRCRAGIHRWEKRRNRESGVPYLECADCRKQKDTMSLTDSSGFPGA